MKNFKRLSIFFLTILLGASCSKEGDVILSSEKKITEFKFLKSLNSHLDNDYIGSISGTTITVNFPYGLSKDALIATFGSSEKSTILIGSVAQVSGQTANNFNNLITITVKAEDGTTADYTVTFASIGNEPISTINQTTSYHLWTKNYFHTNIGSFIESGGGYWGDKFAAQAFYDFDNDGDKDFIAATINFDANLAINIHFYRNSGGVFTKDQSIFGGNIPTFVHARQIILGDFDNNGWMDVVFAAHGFDKDPFPGEQQKILMNNNGTFTTSNLPLPTPDGGNFTFNHSVCSGDIDNDGDIDLFFTNNMRLATSGIFMKNNGTGTFSYDASIFPGEFIKHKPTFTSALYDIDGDGYLDLVIAGHDIDQYHTAEKGQKPTILWGNYTGKYSTSRMTILPVVANYGVSNAISFLDYDQDGKPDILFGKTGDGGSGGQPFYQGYYLQLLKNNGGRNFTDVSTAIQNNSTTSGSWVVWFLAHDVDGDGDTDITSADQWYNLKWKKEGSTFVKY